jgi:hypothetical protein
MTVLGGDPVVMLDVPLAASQRALARSGMTIDQIDLYEVNEAFAPVPLAWLQTLGADPDRLNVNGGAIALGHPLGASGTKLMATLVHALRARGGRYGLQTMCEGGGMANVTIVERLGQPGRAAYRVRAGGPDAGVARYRRPLVCRLRNWLVASRQASPQAPLHCDHPRRLLYPA